MEIGHVRGIVIHIHRHHIWSPGLYVAPSHVIPRGRSSFQTKTLQAVAKIFATNCKFAFIIGGKKGGRVSNQHNEALQSPGFSSNLASQHEVAIGLDGLDHLFKWASDMVADGEDSRVRQARDRRIRREVLEVVQKAREQKIASQAMEEAAYLQRRVIALLQKLTELTEENASLKQIMVSQYYTLQRIPYLESQIKQIRTLEFEREAAVTERRYLMDGLAKLKTERDLLDELVTTCEEENVRVAKLLAEARKEIEELKARRWWHFFLPIIKMVRQWAGKALAMPTDAP